jgi:hypothetical protein
MDMEHINTHRVLSTRETGKKANSKVLEKSSTLMEVLMTDNGMRI